MDIRLVYLIAILGLLLIFVHEQKISDTFNIKINRKTKEVVGAFLVLTAWYFYNKERLF
jgi:uncharacterized membrane protein